MKSKSTKSIVILAAASILALSGAAHAAKNRVPGSAKAPPAPPTSSTNGVSTSPP